MCNVFLCSEGFPVNAGGSLQRSFELIPLLNDNRVGLNGAHVSDCICIVIIILTGKSLKSGRVLQQHSYSYRTSSKNSA